MEQSRACAEHTLRVLHLVCGVWTWIGHVRSTHDVGEQYNVHIHVHHVRTVTGYILMVWSRSGSTRAATPSDVPTVTALDVVLSGPSCHSTPGSQYSQEYYCLDSHSTALDGVPTHTTLRATL